MAFTWVMDHVLYIPIIGLIGLVVAEEALRIDPDFALANNNLGNALLDTGRTPEAIEHYERAVRVSPDNSAMHYNLGGALLRTGRTSEAIEQFELALRIDPTNSSAHFDPVIYARMHYTLGNTLQHTGRLPEATEQYEQAVQLQPDNAEARYSLGNALFQTGRLTEAIEQYEQDLRIEPNHAEAHGNLGLALWRSCRHCNKPPLPSVTCTAAFLRMPSRAFSKRRPPVNTSTSTRRWRKCTGMTRPRTWSRDSRPSTTNSTSIPTAGPEFVQIMQDHGTVRGFESEIYRKDKSTIWISENARAVRDASGAT
jgi:Flp pilus assembly protein TadD